MVIGGNITGDDEFETELPAEILPAALKRSPRLANKEKAQAARRLARSISPSPTKSALPIRTLQKSCSVTPASKAKNPKKRMSSSSSPFDEIHVQELQEAMQRREERNQIRLKELEVAAKKQEIEEQKQKAKLRKFELEAKEREQQMELMRMIIAQRSGFNGMPFPGMLGGNVGNEAVAWPSITNTTLGGDNSTGMPVADDWNFDKY
ncbi:hypothetical protein HGRIS_010184 [Hohenbuehelia grisea]|uniref:Uncharacterized protein n=1 Tax=Hohenbuehelia grisea TaxID=104357 RepID=A0ABR3J3J2_9AGAR